MRQTIDRSIELEHILELPNESGSEADGDNHHFSYNYNMINRDFYQHTGAYINHNFNGLDTTTNSSQSNASMDNSIESDNSDFFAFDKKSRKDRSGARHRGRHSGFNRKKK